MMMAPSPRDVELVCALVGIPNAMIPVLTNKDATVSHLKQEIRAKATGTIQCDAHLLRLFLALKSGKWLEASDPATGLLDQGIRGDEIVAMIEGEGLRSLQSIDSFLANKPNIHPTQVHILVDVPETTESASITWSVTTNPGPPVAFDAKSPVVRLPAAYLHGTGIGYVNEDAVLYFRDQKIRQLCAMRTYSLSNTAVAWMTGAPGTGKSCAAMVLACSIDRTEWDVMWVHVSREDMIKCVSFTNTGKRFCTVDGAKADLLLRELTRNLTKQTVMFLDGYVERHELSKKVYAKLKAWHADDMPKRRLIVVTSVGSPVKYLDEIDDLDSSCSVNPVVLGSLPNDADVDLEFPERPKARMQFELWSWRLQEYMEAIKNKEFFVHVMKYLRSHENQPTASGASNPTEPDYSKSLMSIQVVSAQVTSSATQAKICCDISFTSGTGSNTKWMTVQTKEVFFFPLIEVY